ncbi:hypothetical protein QFZ20_004997 [Flavobacterium sp. W4I14]|nr:hypothetical protein [Flavobacterium sp. W4I14]
MAYYERALLTLENEWLVVLGGFQSRFALYTDEGSVCSLHPIAIGSGLETKVCAPCSPTNEMLLWPSSPG